jgi:hypothetical protein
MGHSKNHSTYNVIIMVISIAILTIYLNHFARMSNGVNAINFLHGRRVYQSGKIKVEQGLDWAFDSYISMKTQIWIRIIEFMIYWILALMFVASFALLAAGPAISFFLYLILLVIQIQKYLSFVVGTEER